MSFKIPAITKNYISADEQLLQIRGEIDRKIYDYNKYVILEKENLMVRTLFP